jgi:hypothetical protein
MHAMLGLDLGSLEIQNDFIRYLLSLLRSVQSTRNNLARRYLCRRPGVKNSTPCTKIGWRGVRQYKDERGTNTVVWKT